MKENETKEQFEMRLNTGCHALIDKCEALGYSIYEGYVMFGLIREAIEEAHEVFKNDKD